MNTEFVRPAMWREHTDARFKELVQLAAGWDGYKAKPISIENIIFTNGILESVMDEVQPIPDIVPGVHGDLHIEWHTTKGDLEVQVVRPNVVYAWLSVVGQEEELEVRLTNDFQIVSAWLSQIKETEIANYRAAA